MQRTADCNIPVRSVDRHTGSGISACISGRPAGSRTSLYYSAAAHRVKRIFRGALMCFCVFFMAKNTAIWYTYCRMKQVPDYTVVFADDDIVVLNKRSGLSIAADRYDPDAPRLDLAAQKEFGTLYAVHRIDKDTSGIIIYAKNLEAHKTLSMQFQERTIEKIYHCLVNGHPLWQDLQVKLPLQPDGDDRHRTVVNRRFGKPSVTSFHCIGCCGPYAWIEARPHTGRTHQIRVHLTANDLSIVCDPLYGGNQKPVRLSDIKRNWHGDTYEERPLLDRLALHAYRITITHPRTGEPMTFTAPYPRDLDAVRKQLAKIFKVDPLA